MIYLKEEPPTKQLLHRKIKILFIGESVSLAHVTRPHTLAQHLDSNQFEVHFASGSFHPFVEKIKQATYHSLKTLSTKRFFEQIAKGKPIYNQQIIKSYVQAELKLISKISPDIIVADSRPTLQISSALIGIPFINLCNAHWSPFSILKFPLPDIPMARFYGKKLSKLILPKIIPLILKQHTKAFRDAQISWGLKPVENIYEMYTAGTKTAYFDISEISPTKNLPDNHCYLGPVLWEPSTKLTTQGLDLSKKITYLSMGSTGDHSIVKKLTRNLIDLGHQVICSGNMPKQNNLYSSSLIPGIQACQIADLVICHGGSGTVYQALTAGKPVIGICKNPDQQFVMQGVEKFGAGVSLNSRATNSKDLMDAIIKIKGNKSYLANALKASEKLKETDPHVQFNEILKELIPLNYKQGA